MSKYVFIESRSPFDSRDSNFVTQVACALKQRGNEVIVYLVQNGVLAARKKADGSHLPVMYEAGVTLLADGFSLRERGIQPAELTPCVLEAGIDALVDLIVTENSRTIWH